MADIFPKRGTSGRKQWTLHDGPRGSIKRLRNQLANEGCPESQVVLAKQLLEDDTELNDKQENARVGVYWLIKASEQGNTEATGLLKQCMETGRGITEHNYLDVRSCISMTQNEKLARKAAREMFANLSNGGEYITSEQLQRKMLAIDRDVDSAVKKLGELQNGSPEPSNGELMNNYDAESDSEEDTDWSARSDSNEKLTEDHLVDAAVNYSHGQLPAVNRVLCLNDPNLQALDHIPVVHRSVLHPLLTPRILYYKLIRFLGSHSLSYYLFRRSELQIIFLLMVYAIVSSENILYIFPMILYYLTVAVMVFTTFRMLQTNREFYDFRIWSGLFISYSGGSLNADEAEYQFITNNLKPYGHFFLALLVNLLVYPIIAEQYIPQSELTLFAFCLTFMTLLGFMYKRRSKTIIDVSILFSFAVNVLAKYPYEADTVVTQGWRFLDLKIPTFASYIISNGIEFCIHFRTLLYCVIPFIFLRLAYRDNWRGIYKYFIPHCVTLSWLQIVIISSQGATMYGLIRGTLALVGFVFFLPLVGLTTIFLPAAALTKWFVNNDYIYTILVFVLLAAIGVSVCFLLAKSRFKTFTSVLQMIFALTAVYFLLGSVANDTDLSTRFSTEKSLPKTITYDQYQKFCHEQRWDNYVTNVAKTQIRCSKLQNIPVSWEGYVNNVQIKAITNKYKYYINKLPSSLSNYLYCYYGDKIEADCNSGDLDECLHFYDIIKSSNKCSLDKYNVYDIQVSVRMQSGLWGKTAEITLGVADGFKNFTLQLKRDDHIWFKGVLERGDLVLTNGGVSGGVRPEVQMNEIGCIACQDGTLTNMKESSDGTFGFLGVVKDVTAGLRTLLNFIFFPVVLFA